MVAPALFSSAKEDWSTPDDLFRALDREFKFCLDAAAAPENAKCPVYFTKEQDALRQDWARGRTNGASNNVPGAVFCNPPYTRDLIDWVEKAFTTSEAGRSVVLLVPARTDTKWFARAFETAADLRLIKGRLKFGGAKTSAPFPSCIFIFYPGYAGVKTVRYYEP